MEEEKKEEKVSAVAAIKRYFERADAIAPNGGKKITMPEITALPLKDRAELGVLAAKELGVTLA